MTVAERKAENAKNADIQVLPAGTGFSKAMPTPFDGDAQLRVGDILHIPTVFEVNHQVFKGITKSDGTHPEGEFIVISVSHPGEADRSINFYPSSLTKPLWRAKKDENGIVSTIPGPLMPKGTAVEKFISFRGQTGPNGETDTQLGMNALAGKDILIPAKDPYDTQMWENGHRINAMTKQSNTTYDFVQDHHRLGTKVLGRSPRI